MNTNEYTYVVAAQRAVSPCHWQESMHSTDGGYARNNTNNSHCKAASLAAKLSVYDRIIVDTCFLLHEGFLSFVKMYGRALIEAGVHFSLRSSVMRELEAKTTNQKKPHAAEAAKYVLSLLEDWTYGSLFIMETDKPVHSGIADFDICHTLAARYACTSQLLLTNDAKLIRAIYNFFPAKEGKKDVVTHVLAMGNDGELGQFDFREHYAQEMLTDWPVLLRQQRNGVRPNKPKHQCQIEAEAAHREMLEASRKAYELGTAANFRFVSEAQELVMDKSALVQLKNSPCQGNFFAELHASGFIASGKRIYVSKASIRASWELQRFVKKHKQYFRVEPACSPDISEETALVHLIYLRIDTYSLKSVRLVSQNHELLKKVLARRPRCYETGLVQSSSLRDNGMFGKPNHAQMSAC